MNDRTNNQRILDNHGKITQNGNIFEFKDAIIKNNNHNNNFQNSTNDIAQYFGGNSNVQHTLNISNKVNIDENILKLVNTLYSFAKTNNKIDELKTDLSSLLPKYM